MPISAMINDICGTTGPNGQCNGTYYQKYVQPHLPYCPTSGKNANCAPILTDIANCNLPAVSWVIPDGNWSDHAGGPYTEKGDGGPSWVANIYNAVGGYGPPTNTCGYWNNTVILVVWDDWGGTTTMSPRPIAAWASPVDTSRAPASNMSMVSVCRWW
jgi:phospholipase C